MIFIGYDYGTTTSWMASCGEDGNVRIVSKHSAVLLNREGREYGEEAIVNMNNGNAFVRSPKRYIVGRNQDRFGEDYGCTVKQVLQEFSNRILNELYGFHNNVADNQQPVYVTVTIPNCYDGEQMRFMRECMEEVFTANDRDCHLFLLPEPVAAALYYVMSTEPRGRTEEHYVVTCDIGGGTTDLSVIWIRRRFDNNRLNVTFRVMATADGKFGGDDIDNFLFDSLINEPNLDDELGTKQRLKNCKEQLSTIDHVGLDYFLKDGTRINRKIYRNHVESLLIQRGFNQGLIDLINRLRRDTERAYRERTGRDFNWENVLLLPVGGSMRIPFLRNTFRLGFHGAEMYDLGNEANEMYNSVAYGALNYSMIMQGNHPAVSRVFIEGRNRLPISIEYLRNRLYPIVQANMPDGDYSTNRLRPFEISQDGSFNITELRLFLRDDKCINDGDDADFILEVNKTFMANGRNADDIPIRLDLTVENSDILSAKITIENIDPAGGNFVREYTQDEIRRRGL